MYFAIPNKGVTPYTNPTIPAAEWNLAMDELRRNLPLHCCSGRSPGAWRHPWQITPEYDATRKEWLASVEPGFVNGDETTVAVPAKFAPAETLSRLRVPAAAGLEVEAHLTESPRISLANRREVTGAAVPAYFVALGASNLEPKASFDEFGAVTIPDLPQDRRRLKACDIVLHKEHVATNAQVTIGAGVDGSFGQANLTYANLSFRQQAYVRVVQSYAADLVSNPLERLAGGWIGTPFTSLLIGTVFFLSPAAAGDDAPVDGTWETHVKHAVFWNLNHAVNVLRVPDAPQVLTLPLPLAGGVAQPLVNQQLALINDNAAAVSQFLANNTISGVFWGT